MLTLIITLFIVILVIVVISMILDIRYITTMEKEIRIVKRRLRNLETETNNYEDLELTE